MLENVLISNVICLSVIFQVVKVMVGSDNRDCEPKAELKKIKKTGQEGQPA